MNYAGTCQGGPYDGQLLQSEGCFYRVPYHPDLPADADLRVIVKKPDAKIGVYVWDQRQRCWKWKP